MTTASFVLSTFCQSRPGIVAALSTAIFELGCNIDDLQQFDDHETDQFFARIAFAPMEREMTKKEVLERLKPDMERFGMTWKLRDADARRRVLLLASKFDHCLSDLLYRWRIGELRMDVVGVVSNHPRATYANLSFRDTEFRHLPVTKDTKAEQEAELLKIIEDEKVDLVVLARYMQILSDGLSKKLHGRCINIHHSFLPGFKGAKPYHQAYVRGVKLIGATAHYVTSDLDEGPIIEQDIERISHRERAEELVRKGRDIERRVLARAVRSHLDDRVLLNGMRTIVFPD